MGVGFRLRGFKFGVLGTCRPTMNKKYSPSDTYSKP